MTTPPERESRRPTPSRLIARALRGAAVVLAVLGLLAGALVWWRLDTEPFAAMPALMIAWPWSQALVPLNAAMHVQLAPWQGKLLLSVLLLLNPLWMWLLARWLTRR